jgi:nucleoid-associated protein YgaU
MFLFRDLPATAISLRRKLRVRDGEDSARGPFIAARVRDSVVAFWVDEVQDVLDDPGVSWRPMPEELDGGLFDGYTIRDDNLILHTRFETLFDAPGGVDAVAHRAAQSGRPSTDAARPAQDRAADVADGAALKEPDRPRAAAQAPARTSVSTGRPPHSPRGLQRIKPARRAPPRREIAPRTTRPVHVASRFTVDESPPRAAIPRAPELAPAAPLAALHSGRRRVLWPVAGLALLAVIAASLWPMPARKPPSIGPAPSTAVPAPAKFVPSREAGLPFEPAAPKQERTRAKPRPAPPVEVRDYDVVRGDTLWAIARRFLGDPHRYPELVRNSEIRNPDLIHPGDIVRIELGKSER